MTNAPQKEIIILQHGGGELANQLWNFASIYAYCQEKGFDCQNYSFFEYAQYFNIPLRNKVVDFFFFRPFSNSRGRRSALKTRFWRFIYKFYVEIIIFFHKRQVVSSINTRNEKYYLPPTQETPLLSSIENNSGVLYFTGWLFRNPKGLKKYQEQITEYLKPKLKYTESVEARINAARKTYKHVIGVHIRQTDYRTHKGGMYFIPPERVRVVLEEYLTHFHKDLKETLFIIASDEHVDEKTFRGLNTTTSGGNVIEDLYTLSLCDAIIGSNSSFGNFAAYYGNKPHIVLQKESMDWGYYEDKKSYFENKYSVMSL